VNARRQKIFVAVGAVVLLGLLGFEVVPKLTSASGGSGTSEAAPPLAVPLAKPAAPVTAAGPSLPKGITRLAERDVFVPQVSAGGSAPSTTHDVFPRAPAVRAKGFVVKDPFIAQVVVPAAPVAPVASASPVPFPDQTVPLPTKPTSIGTYIVVIAEITGTSHASQMAAARAVVAAKNAGLKDVVANDTLGPRTGPHAHFTVFTGPFTTASGLQTELQRAHRNGYPSAFSVKVTNTPIGGF